MCSSSPWLWLVESSDKPQVLRLPLDFERSLEVFWHLSGGPLQCRCCEVSWRVGEVQTSQGTMCQRDGPAIQEISASLPPELRW